MKPLVVTYKSGGLHAGRQTASTRVSLAKADVTACPANSLLTLALKDLYEVPICSGMACAEDTIAVMVHTKLRPVLSSQGVHE